jgi:hypothetical protein
MMHDRNAAPFATRDQRRQAMTRRGKRLLALARKQTELSPTQILAAIEEPQWTPRLKVRDWRNHVDHDLRGLWHDLDVETKLALFLIALKRTSAELWD